MDENAHALQEDAKLATKWDILLAAAQDPSGTIKLVRYDRDEGKMTTDIISWDMPPEEIII